MSVHVSQRLRESWLGLSVGIWKDKRVEGTKHMPVTVFYLVLEVKVKPHEQQQIIFLALYPIKYSWNLQSFLRRSARPWPLCLHCLILAPVCALPFQCGLQPLVSGKPGSIWAGVGALQPSVCHSGVLQGSLLRTEMPAPVCVSTFSCLFPWKTPHAISFLLEL